MPENEPDIEESATVLVAIRSGRSTLGRSVKAGGEVTDALRGFASETRNFVREHSGATYDPGAEQDDDDGYLNASTDELLDTDLLQELRKGHSLSPVTSDELRKPIAAYALAVGDNPESLTIFVRKRTPVQLARRSLVAALVDNSLTRVKDALFAFDNSFDVVIYSDSIQILNQANFEALFKESEAVLAKTGEWVGELRQSIPMSHESAERLSSRIRGNSIMRRRIQSILRSDYLENLSQEALRQKMVQRGMDPAKMLDDDGIVVNASTEKDLLELLNEDIWTGDFSGRQYASSHKRRR